ncbi:unnamed protein product [Calicophoron daubneyi]|uniref:NADP-dependent oxidoreductase domain-containing protein n=1 Tax=Calicophoron daubneyi TaxID=300641 RepID=A0AAV2T023_CALDB
MAHPNLHLEKLTMSNGLKIPTLGYGTYDIPPSAVKIALEAGYRHIDCAYFYGNEKEIGKYLEEGMRGLGIDRKDIFITSKVWFTHLHPEMVRKSCEETLKNLRLDYLDLLLFHWPTAFKLSDSGFSIDGSATKYEVDLVPLKETWEAMEQLVGNGLVKSIGLSNFNKRQIDEILKNCTIKPAVLQIEMHANFPNSKLVEYAQSLGLIVTSYGPLGSPGIFPIKGNLIGQPWVKKIAEDHGRTASQVLLRYLIQRGAVVIPKASSRERIIENTRIFDFALTAEEMDTMDRSGTNERLFKLPGAESHPEYPFHDEY